MLRGRCSWRVPPGFGNLWNQICLGNITWTCWDFFNVFLQKASSFVQSTAVGSATFCRDLLLQLLNPYHIISAVTALQAAAQLEVACPIFCVLRHEHLSIDRPVLVHKTAEGKTSYSITSRFCSSVVENCWDRWCTFSSTSMSLIPFYVE